MRKLLVVAASIFLLTAGAAFAQDDETALDVAPDGDTWVGASTGYPLGLTAHYGLGDALGEDIDLRFNGNFNFFSNTVSSGFGAIIGADALFAIPVDSEEFGVYAGAGPNLGFETASDISGLSVGGFRLGAQALAGAEYLVSDAIGIFGEFRLGFKYVTGTNFTVDPTLALGANYHF